ncbi:MAG: hypothetical protein V2A73_11185 [Pseudomonadota bacterium]
MAEKTSAIMIRCTPEQHALISELAERKGLSVSSLALSLLIREARADAKEGPLPEVSQPKKRKS